MHFFQPPTPLFKVHLLPYYETNRTNAPAQELASRSEPRRATRLLIYPHASPYAAVSAGDSRQDLSRFLKHFGVLV